MQNMTNLLNKYDCLLSLLGLKMTTFVVLSEIFAIETIAIGNGVHIKRYLERTYGKGRWRKMKGFATVQLVDGTICEAEIHWFEAHGIGRKDMKIKQVIQ